MHTLGAVRCRANVGQVGRRGGDAAAEARIMGALRRLCPQHCGRPSLWGQSQEDVWLPRSLVTECGASVSTVASGAKMQPAWHTLTQKAASRVSPGVAGQFFLIKYLVLHPKIIQMDG